MCQEPGRDAGAAGEAGGGAAVPPDGESAEGDGRFNGQGVNPLPNA